MRKAAGVKPPGSSYSFGSVMTSTPEVASFLFKGKKGCAYVRVLQALQKVLIALHQLDAALRALPDDGQPGLAPIPLAPPQGPPLAMVPLLQPAPDHHGGAFNPVLAPPAAVHGYQAQGGTGQRSVLPAFEPPAWFVALKDMCIDIWYDARRQVAPLIYLYRFLFYVVGCLMPRAILWGALLAGLGFTALLLTNPAVFVHFLVGLLRTLPGWGYWILKTIAEEFQKEVLPAQLQFQLNGSHCQFDHAVPGWSWESFATTTTSQAPYQHHAFPAPAPAPSAPAGFSHPPNPPPTCTLANSLIMAAVAYAVAK